MGRSELMAVSLGYALVLAALFTAVIVGGLLVARDALLDDYPPAIRERHGPQSPRGKRTAAVMGLLNALLFVALPLAGVRELHGRTEDTLGFWPAFVLGGVAFLVLVLTDLLVLDWLLFCTVRPRFMVLPGTDGMPEYRDYAFHWRVLVPRPVPWPPLAIPGYGVAVGAVSAVAEALVA
ncbi:hypothetical protein [Streptomyces botrytidirepellens]|uniref:NADH dehydrogenase subunit n=1 Tax=Streptomyces botrytidirepellens TaxID=2486417 RepID=A0A3M8T2H1_9ACTN|nr:hypothetical protein [Streptomyces botrytidirepellens]RNF87145.1 hypothetical protein EEJ42_42425 [Streptomyces botrytidirepellens]